MGLLDMVCRIGMALVAGGIIGAEREATHRPAGLRTHMLVALGAALVMMLGDYAFTVYQGRASVDPTRLGAQVVSGIGFLGAGTIMREGLTIRGLTTAASLWAVACVGLAAGAGFYQGAALGTLMILVTLYVLERIQERVMRNRPSLLSIVVSCRDTSQILVEVTGLATQYRAEINDFSVDRTDEGYKLTFKLRLAPGRDRGRESAELLAALSGVPGIQHLDTQCL
ncbi:MAG: MgtC/SapB family protein [Intestinibacillus sp.]